MSAICVRCGMLSKSIATNGMCVECNASVQHFIGVGEKRMAQAIAELKERNRKQDADIIDMREAIRKRDAEIAMLRERIKALEGLISGAIQHSWTPEDYDKFWLAVGE